MKIFNKQLKKEIVDELKRVESKYFIFDKPVPLKPGLFLYPVALEDHDEFLICSSLCTLNKNATPQGIAMTNLGYLIHMLSVPETKEAYTVYLSRLFEMVFKTKNGVYCKDCGNILEFKNFFTKVQEDPNYSCENCGKNNFAETIKIEGGEKPKLFIRGKELLPKEFDRMRQIVMYQNLPDYKDDSWVHEDIKKDQAEKARISNSGSPKVSATLEKKVVCVATKTSYKIDELLKLSMRKFLMLLSTVDDLISYETSRIGAMSGMVSFKKPLEHWIYKNSDSNLYEAAVTKDAMAQKLK